MTSAAPLITSPATYSAASASEYDFVNASSANPSNYRAPSWEHYQGSDAGTDAAATDDVMADTPNPISTLSSPSAYEVTYTPSSANTADVTSPPFSYADYEIIDVIEGISPPASPIPLMDEDEDADEDEDEDEDDDEEPWVWILPFCSHASSSHFGFADCGMEDEWDE